MIVNFTIICCTFLSNEISIKWQSTKIMYGSITRIIVNPSIFNYTLSTPFFLLREFSLWIKMEWIEEKVGILVLWLFLVNGTDHSLVYHKYFLLKINVGVSEQWPPLPFTWIVSTCSQWHITHIWWLSHLVVVTFGGCHIWWSSSNLGCKKKKRNKKGENNLYSKVYSNDFCYAHTFYKQPNSNPVIKVLTLSGNSLK